MKDSLAIFTITQSDRTGVIIYRMGLLVAALSFAIASWLIFISSQQSNGFNGTNSLYALFCLALR
jgi:uncharacterized integral membrane protein